MKQFINSLIDSTEKLVQKMLKSKHLPKSEIAVVRKVHHDGTVDVSIAPNDGIMIENIVNIGLSKLRDNDSVILFCPFGDLGSSVILYKNGEQDFRETDDGIRMGMISDSFAYEKRGTIFSPLTENMYGVSVESCELDVPARALSETFAYGKPNIVYGIAEDELPGVTVEANEINAGLCSEILKWGFEDV